MNEENHNGKWDQQRKLWTNVLNVYLLYNWRTSKENTHVNVINISLFKHRFSIYILLCSFQTFDQICFTKILLKLIGRICVSGWQKLLPQFSSINLSKVILRNPISTLRISHPKLFLFNINDIIGCWLWLHRCAFYLLP